MYRRNRYYDPVTGRFTQEDPLGLAGGLNLYGFAAGDPVNFSDPFGLCPEKMRDKDGRCPGGLTVEQWRRVEYAANNRMQKEARDRVLKLLREGRIHAGQMVDPASGAETRPGNITVQPDQFEVSPSSFAWQLAHESQHIEQFSGLTGQVQWRWMGLDDRFGYGLVRSGLEHDAYSYGCAYSYGVTNPRLLHICASGVP